MIKRIIGCLVPMAMICTAMLTGCFPQASDTVSEKTVSLEGGVYSLELSGLGVVMAAEMDAEVNCGSENTCVLKVNEDVMKNLTVEVNETEKKIKLSGDCKANGVKLNFKVNAMVNSIDASGAYDITYNAGTGLSDIAVELSGACDIEIKGECTNVKFDASGGSDIKALELKTENAEAHASGGSDIELYASKKLTASASGGSDIEYAGSPEEVNKDASGGSSIEPVR